MTDTTSPGSNGDSLREFVGALLTALDYAVEHVPGGIVVQRRLLGTDSMMYVRCTSSLIGAGFRYHLEAFEQVREEHPNAVLRLIVENPPAPAYRDSASAAGIILQTRVEFLNDLIDSTKIARQVLKDEGVRSSAQNYVEQDLRDESGELLGVTSTSFVLGEWLRAPNKTLLVILAPAGHGKTSLTRALAHRLALEHQFDPSLPVPLLVPFGEYRTLTDFRGLVLRRLEDAQVMFTSLAFQHVLSQGRATLLLDGFDELSEEAGYEVSKHNLRQLSEHIAGSGAKVVITSRSAFFRTSRELADSILRHFSPDAITVVELAEFTRAQQRKFLLQAKADDGEPKYGPSQVDRVIGRIQADTSLQALAGSPLLLGLLAETTAEGPIASRAALYDVFAAFVFARERERYEYELTDEQQLAFLADVARDMYKDNVFVYDKDDLLTYFVDPAIDDIVSLAEDTELERARLREKLGDHALLDAAQGGRSIQFRHPTFRDFFVAKWLVELTRAENADALREAIERRRLPESVAEFLAEMLDTPIARRFCEIALSGGPVADLTRSWNGVKVACAMANRAGEDSLGASEIFRRLLDHRTQLVGLDLREMNFRHLDLSQADFRRTNLEDATFVRSSLREASFASSVIKQTAFLRCDLTGASFNDATTLLSVKLEGEDTFIETNAGVRQWLYDNGANVDETDLVSATRVDASETAEELVRHVFRKFYRLGKSHWDSSLRYDSLLSGLGGERRRLVDSRVIPILRGQGFLRDEHKGGRLIMWFEPGRKAEVRAFLDDGTTSDAIQELLVRVSTSIA